MCDELTVWRVDDVTSSLVAPGADVLACHRSWLKSSLLKMEATFSKFSELILRHSKTCDVWWRLTSKKKTVIYDRVWQPANDCRYLATGIGWRPVLGPILRNQHCPCRTALKHAPVCCPYCDRITTALTKKHNMSSFLEDFRQKFSRTRFPVHTAMWRPYNPAVLPGRAQRASHGSKVIRIAPVVHGRTTRPCNTARVIRLCVSAFRDEQPTIHC